MKDTALDLMSYCKSSGNCNPDDVQKRFSNNKLKFTRDLMTLYKILPNYPPSSNKAMFRDSYKIGHIMGKILRICTKFH